MGGSTKIWDFRARWERTPTVLTLRRRYGGTRPGFATRRPSNRGLVLPGAGVARKMAAWLVA